jgi:purine nucleoside permease
MVTGTITYQLRTLPTLVVAYIGLKWQQMRQSAMIVKLDKGNRIIAYRRHINLHTARNTFTMIKNDSNATQWYWQGAITPEALLLAKIAFSFTVSNGTGAPSSSS